MGSSRSKSLGSALPWLTMLAASTKRSKEMYLVVSLLSLKLSFKP